MNKKYLNNIKKKKPLILNAYKSSVVLLCYALYDKKTGTVGEDFLFK